MEMINNFFNGKIWIFLPAQDRGVRSPYVLDSKEKGELFT